MKFSTVADLGLFVQDFRKGKRLTQHDLAEAAGVSRRWLADFEAGKPTVELGLVLRTLAALDLALHVQRESSDTDADDVLRSLDRGHGG